MNCVYNKKISYVLCIKIKIIRVTSVLVTIVVLNACSLNPNHKELFLKVSTAGVIEKPANYIFIHPEVYNNNLRYQAVLKEIEDKLSLLGFVKTANKDNAKYAFTIYINSLFSKTYWPAKSTDSQLKIKDNNYSMHLSKNISHNFNPDAMVLEVYLLQDAVLSHKVFEGYTFIYGPKTTLPKWDKGTLGFALCSIEGLFDKDIINQSKYQEYYYKCF